MVKRRGLGRGLDALLVGSHDIAPIISSEKTASHNQREFRQLPIECLQPGQYQPRKDMHPEALEELAASIRAQGIIQPIVVRPLNDGYEIIAGERRWRAAQLAELSEVPVLVKDIPDQAAIAIALIENIQRENLNPLEEARALRRLLDEFSMTHQSIAQAVGKSRTTVTNFLRLLNLNVDVKTLVEHGDLEMGHARALLALQDNAQSQAAERVVAKELSVRETEHLVRRLLQGKKSPAAKAEIDPDIRQLQEELSDRLGAKVAIHHTAKGKGKITIHYNSTDELEGILAHFE